VVSGMGQRTGKGEDEGNREINKHTLLPAAELLDPLLIIMFAIETDADPHPRVILHALPLRLLLGILLLPGDLPVRLPLDHEPSPPRGHQLLEHARKLPRDLLERALDGLVLALIEHGDQLLDGRVRGIEFLPPLREGIPLVGELVVLLKGLFVHVAVFLEGLVDFMQPLDDGIALRPLELGKGFLRQDAEVADAAADFGGLFRQERFLLDALFHALLLPFDALGDVFLLATGFRVTGFELGDLRVGAVDGFFDFEEFGREGVRGFGDALEVFLRVAEVALDTAVDAVEGLGSQLFESRTEVFSEFDFEGGFAGFEFAASGRNF